MNESIINALVHESFVHYNSVSEAEQKYLLQDLKNKIETHEKGMALIGFGFDQVKVEAAKRFIEKVSPRQSRCCGRCDGNYDICVADRICEEHQIEGCETCYGKRNISN